MLLPLVGYVGFLGYVLGCFGIAAVSASWFEVTFAVTSTVTDRDNVVTLPIFASTDLTSAQMATPSSTVKNT
jgi:hypothetical protein